MVNIIHLLIVVVRSISGIINDGALRIKKDNLCENDKAFFFRLSSFYYEDEDNADDHLLQFNHRRSTFTTVPQTSNCDFRYAMFGCRIPRNETA